MKVLVSFKQQTKLTEEDQEKLSAILGEFIASFVGYCIATKLLDENGECGIDIVKENA